MATTIKTWILCALLFPIAAHAAASGDKGAKVEIKKEAGKLRIEIGGEHFADYVYEGYARPILFPMLGPGGVRLTRNWPIVEGTPDEDHDHPHHKGLWWGHGDMNGVDFWAEGKKSGKIVHQGFTEVKGGSVGVIHSQNKYVSDIGGEVCTDDRTLRIYGTGEPRVMDFEITLHALDKDLALGDTKEGTLAVRLNETMKLKGKVAKGHIINSEGLKDDDTWGKAADWVDYHGPADGKLVGIAIFDHPSNPRHPTHWHVRDYGLFAVNPFGLHDFGKGPPGTGAMTIPKGTSVTWKYRFYIHSGDEKEARVADAYRKYAKGGTEKK